VPVPLPHGLRDRAEMSRAPSAQRDHGALRVPPKLRGLVAPQQPAEPPAGPARDHDHIESELSFGVGECRPERSGQHREMSRRLDELARSLEVCDGRIEQHVTPDPMAVLAPAARRFDVGHRRDCEPGAISDRELRRGPYGAVGL